MPRENKHVFDLQQSHHPSLPYSESRNHFSSPNDTKQSQHVSAHFPVPDQSDTEHRFPQEYQSQLSQDSNLPQSNAKESGRVFSVPYATDITSPYYSSSTPPTSPSDEAILSQALSFMKHTAPTPFHTTSLPRPIAIPQTTHGSGQSFLRAYPPSLLANSITQTNFISFIDGLNLVSTPNPPLQALDAAGGLLGMVPHHWPQLAGAGIQAFAKLGTAVVSKSRAEIYIKEANVKMFMPRGLNVCIAWSKTMRVILGIPEMQPLMAPLTPETMEMSTLERELLAVRQYTASLDFNMPEPAEQTTLLAKLSARQVLAQAKKNQKKAVKERKKAVEKDEKKRRQDEEKRARKERKEEKHGQKGDRRKKRESEIHGDGNGRSRSVGGPYKEKDDKKSKEEKNAEKVSWVIIKNL